MRATLLGTAILALTLAAGPALADLVSVMVDFDDRQDHAKAIEAARGAGVELLMRRATLGVGDVDANLGATLKATRAAKLMAGAYHVIYPLDTPTDDAHRAVAQAHDFLKAVAGACVSGQPVLLAVDWEQPLRHGALLPAASPALVADFTAEVTRLTGADVVVYTNAQTTALYAGQIPDALAARPLWLASYHRYVRFDLDPGPPSVQLSEDAITLRLPRPRYDTLSVPAPEQYAPWKAMTFWQFSDASWSPISALEPTLEPLDTSWFVGSREAFRAFFARTAWKCKPALAASLAGSGPAALAPGRP